LVVISLAPCLLAARRCGNPEPWAFARPRILCQYAIPGRACIRALSWEEKIFNVHGAPRLRSRFLSRNYLPLLIPTFLLCCWKTMAASRMSFTLCALVGTLALLLPWLGGVEAGPLNIRKFQAPFGNGHWSVIWTTMPQLVEPQNLPAAPYVCLFLPERGTWNSMYLQPFRMEARLFSLARLSVRLCSFLARPKCFVCAFPTGSALPV
jgi:hypothetical protein